MADIKGNIQKVNIEVPTIKISLSIPGPPGAEIDKIGIACSEWGNWERNVEKLELYETTRIKTLWPKLFPRKIKNGSHEKTPLARSIILCYRSKEERIGLLVTRPENPEFKKLSCHFNGWIKTNLL